MQGFLSDRERLQRSRDPDRLRSSQLIERVLSDFVRAASPDPALITGSGYLGDLSVLVFAQEKPHSRDAKQAADVNYGMMSAIGYWYVVEKLDHVGHAGQAVLFLVDTPGADPSKEGSENLLAWAISSCTRRLLTFPGPTVSLVLGEGGSGGALAMQVADRRLMMHDAIFSTISPESCSAILFRTPDKIDEAMRILRPSAEQMCAVGVVDEVVTLPENLINTHHDSAAKYLGERLREAFEQVRQRSGPMRVSRRHEAYLRIGRLASEHGGQVVPRRLEDVQNLKPPRMEKFAHLSRDDDTMSAVRHAYFLAKGPRVANTSDEADMVCPRDRGGCGVLFSRQAYTQAYYACPSCGRGDRLSSEQWIALLCNGGAFEELFADLDLADLAHAGYDTPDYKAQRARLREKLGVGESMRVGTGLVGEMRVAMAVSDFRFFGGTLGAVAGEKLWLLCQIAREEHLPLLTVTCSGGVRMQDGTLGLAQMAKTVAAVNTLMETNLPYVSILADPCTGGALGSYATAANGILAEPSALVAFAGPRVMRMAGLPLNEQAMVSNRFVEYGGVDEVVPRSRLAARVRRYLELKPMLRRHQHHKTASQTARAPGSDIAGWFDDLLARASAVLQDSNSALSNKSVLVDVQAMVIERLADLALISVPLLLEQAAGSQNARVRASAIEALGGFPKTDRPQLAQALTDEHHRVRANAALALLRRSPQDPEALKVIDALLAAPDPVHRRSGLFTLTRGPVEYFRQKVRALAEDDDLLVRLSAVIALFSYHDDEAATLLKPMLTRLGAHAESKVRQMLQFMPEASAWTLHHCLESLAIRADRDLDEP